MSRNNSIHKENRKKHILSGLVSELFGPSNYHKDVFGTSHYQESVALDISEKHVFKGWDQVRENIYRQKDNGEEILSGKDTPSKRYSVGILYPPNQQDILEDSSPTEDENENDSSESFIEEENELFDVLDEEDSEYEEGVSDYEDNDLDYDLTTSNQLLQSSAGLSICVTEDKLSLLKIKVSGGVYRPINNIEINWEKDGEPLLSKPTWWARQSFHSVFETVNFQKNYLELRPTESSHPDFEIAVKIYKKKIRTASDVQDCILTIVVMNENDSSDKNTQSLFQTYFEIIAADDEGNSVIKPYPENTILDENDYDGLMLKQLYSNKKVYAIGHGVSADWQSVKNTLGPDKVFASFLPVYELPLISPDIEKSKDERLAPSMRLLCSSDNDLWNEGFQQILDILEEYEAWISLKQSEIDDSMISKRILEDCNVALERMKDGLNLLNENENVQKAFKWMNEAMLDQQTRINDLRHPTFPDFKNASNIDWGQYPGTDQDKGYWRAFQIAFIVMNLRSIVEPERQDLRENVELIWFPTGGGKTEAYFGLAAFSILWRRLSDPADSGTDVIMRYTLRLLTTQQYQRASSLICALDLLRKNHESELGTERITLGLWIGGGSSPNTIPDIQKAWSKLNSQTDPQNKFVINQCPWCGAEMGISRLKKTPEGLEPLGIDVSLNEISFHCPDKRCAFSVKNEKLPLYVDDQSIKEKKPSMIIGTIDKLALLAFETGSNSHSVFGKDIEGSQVTKPPSLIIQDELHLISGPLGSIAGIWESIIEDFCSDYSDPNLVIRPKIICSTATIRKYEEQILSLYGRKDSTLFPPPGIDSSDSFFGKEISENGSGKLFVGVLTPSIGSNLVAQTRVFTSLLQSPTNLQVDEQDPWYTLMIFFNSLRELGGAETLFQTDIPDYLGVYKDRHPNKKPRYANYRLRLTGELSNDELPTTLEQLENSTSDGNPVDVCLATNILEVGVDIQRLSLMSVVGQPKTTSTYIQATGRVGRGKDRPGMVVTIFSPFKPRDRSHYEKFRTYHETLYSQVEPTSVTPFSSPALEKALHAALIAYVKINGNKSTKDSPDPFPDTLVKDFYQLMEKRAEFIFANQEYKDPDLLSNFRKILDKRIGQWKRWQKQDWEYKTNRKQYPLIVRAGTDETASGDTNVWPTMMNMRNVDPECKLKITADYINEEDY